MSRIRHLVSLVLLAVSCYSTVVLIVGLAGPVFDLLSICKLPLKLNESVASIGHTTGFSVFRDSSLHLPLKRENIRDECSDRVSGVGFGNTRPQQNCNENVPCLNTESAINL